MKKRKEKYVPTDWEDLSEQEQRKQMIESLTGKIASRGILQQLTTGELEMACIRLGDLIGEVETTVWKKIADEEARIMEDRQSNRWGKFELIYDDSPEPLGACIEISHKPLWTHYDSLSKRILEMCPHIQTERKTWGHQNRCKQLAEEQ